MLPTSPLWRVSNSKRYFKIFQLLPNTPSHSLVSFICSVDPFPSLTFCTELCQWCRSKLEGIYEARQLLLAFFSDVAVQIYYIHLHYNKSYIKKIQTKPFHMTSHLTWLCLLLFFKIWLIVQQGVSWTHNIKPPQTDLARILTYKFN